MLYDMQGRSVQSLVLNDEHGAHATLLQALGLFYLPRIDQQEEGHERHAHRHDHTDGEGDLWRDPGPMRA